MCLETVCHTPCASQREFEGYSLPQSVNADDVSPIVRAMPFGEDTDSIPPQRGIARARYPHRSEYREPKKTKPRIFKARYLVDMSAVVPSPYGPHTSFIGPMPLPPGVDVMTVDHGIRYAYTIVRHAVSGQFPAWHPDRIADLAEDCASDARLRWLEGRTRSTNLKRCIRSVISARVRAITGDAARHRQALVIEHASVSPIGTDALRAALVRGLTSGSKLTDAARAWGESLATGEPLPGKATRCPKGVMAELLAIAKAAE